MSNDRTVLLPTFDLATANFFKNKGFHVSTDLFDTWTASLVVFVGGEDVSPFLYGERTIKGTHTNPTRDLFEISALRMCPNDTPKIGICRGAQFLNVMNGGSLYQDVDKHGVTHRMWDVDNSDERISVTSTHHQMMIPHELGKIISVARETTLLKWAGGTTKPDAKRQDIEVVHYPHTNTLCFQYHPEYNHATAECRAHFWQKTEELLGVKGT